MVELERLNQVWNRAWLDKDVATVERLMSPEYVYIAPNGQLVDRETILGVIRSPSYQLSRGTRTEARITPLGPDAAALVHRWQGAGTFEGNSFTDDHRCTMICVRREKEWLVVLEQCSPITP